MTIRNSIPRFVDGTFDALASKYDKPQTLEEVLNWFSQAGLSDVQVERGSNGIVGNGTKL